MPEDQAFTSRKTSESTLDHSSSDRVEVLDATTVIRTVVMTTKLLPMAVVGELTYSRDPDIHTKQNPISSLYASAPDYNLGVKTVARTVVMKMTPGTTVARMVVMMITPSTSVVRTVVLTTVRMATVRT